MENKTLEKTLDMATSVAKVAANLSEPKKETNTQPKTLKNDDSNRANQSVFVSVDGNKGKNPKPEIKHIHEFPEARALTPQECDVALRKAQMEYELKQAQMAFENKVADREWQHKLEVEQRNERKGKIRRAIAYILGACGIGYGT